MLGLIIILTALTLIRSTLSDIDKLLHALVSLMVTFALILLSLLFPNPRLILTGMIVGESVSLIRRSRT